ncbi:MAG: hypothetical protein GXO21_02955, partial [Aquificae bacterium]|nr:hypothetical protein [Aquificota bacterium]
FASGPTNYYGDSNQNLKIFILDLDTGELVRIVDKFKNFDSFFDEGSCIKNAFGGRLFTEGLDIDKNGITDYIALGYSKKSKNSWKGGLLFADVRALDPDNWEFIHYLSDINPITAKIEFMKCFGSWYMYFGTGRWFYKTDESFIKENNALYGIKLDCSHYGCLLDTDTIENSEYICQGETLKKSWKVLLEKNPEGYFPERVITDPSITNRNTIIFVSTEPTENICEFGGRTRVWALNCATGEALAEECPQYPIKRINGKVLIQLSGGDVREIYLKDLSYRNIDEGFSRYSNWMKGIPPSRRAKFFLDENKLKTGEFLLWFER